MYIATLNIQGKFGHKLPQIVESMQLHGIYAMVLTETKMQKCVNPMDSWELTASGGGVYSVLRTKARIREHAASLLDARRLHHQRGYVGHIFGGSWLEQLDELVRESAEDGGGREKLSPQFVESGRRYCKRSRTAL